jgi:DNA polymerase-1
MSRLVLIDGSSYLFRAFHALPPLTAPDGAPTGALLGIVNMLRATLKENPDYTAFVLDASGPTFRDELYPEYKANRPPMPEDLRAQVDPMIRIVEALGFPLLRVAGVEADDVIGTLALQAQAAGIPVVISTSDKDFAQLVRPGITLNNTMTGSVMDEAGVVEKFGVRADQIVDFLALMGDTVDNVPGVDKCGPKTAAKWLAEYNDLDAVIAGAERIGGKIGENLRSALPRTRCASFTPATASAPRCASSTAAPPRRRRVRQPRPQRRTRRPMRPWAWPVSTNASPTWRGCRTGSCAYRPLPWCPSTPKPIHSTRCAPTWLA